MKKLIALLLLASPAALAEHRPEFQALIGEPADMLDIAMLRLQDFVAWTAPNMTLEYQTASGSEIRHQVNVTAYYSKKDGVIVVSASLFDRESSLTQMKAGCQRVLRMMSINVSKSLHRLFSHADGSFRPTVDGEPVDHSSMFSLSCSVYGQSTEDVRFSEEASLRPD